jgi:hypothetical protein
MNRNSGEAVDDAPHAQQQQQQQQQHQTKTLKMVNVFRKITRGIKKKSAHVAERPAGEEPSSSSSELEVLSEWTSSYISDTSSVQSGRWNRENSSLSSLAVKVNTSASTSRPTTTPDQKLGENNNNNNNDETVTSTSLLSTAEQDGINDNVLVMVVYAPPPPPPPPLPHAIYLWCKLTSVRA